MRRARLSAALAALLLAAMPLRAQGPSRAELRELRARMDAFADSMRGYGPSESFAEWFPREGSWAWSHTLRGAPGGDRVAVWRFPAAQTAAALADTGPLCDPFFRGGGEVGTDSLSIAGRLSYDSARWRRTPNSISLWRWICSKAVPDF